MIFVEKNAEAVPLVKNLISKGTSFELVEDGFTPEDIKTNILITGGMNTFVHRCPATKIYRCCNYHVVDNVEGCPFDCTYCILQSYLNHDYIKVYADLHLIENDIKKLASSGSRYRLGTGELSDSLALDKILHLSDFYIPLINSMDNIQFEFKTKSANVSNLLNHNPKNIIVSWSMNPEFIINTEEHGAAKLDDRIEAAKKVIAHGYKVSFHFDPVIFYEGWEDGYSNLLQKLFDNIPQESVEFISISTFRFIPDLIHCIRDRFDESVLLKSSYTAGLDGKMRYFKPLRAKLLKFMVNNIRNNWKKTYVYFCMEHDSLWNKIIGHDPGERESLEQEFPFYK